MHGRQSVGTAVLLAAVTATALGQGQPPATDPEIVTDRPDVTESSIVVPKGSLQLENGLTWTKDHNESWSIGGMQSLFSYTEVGKRNLVWEPTFYLEKQITKPWDVFA